MTFTKQRQMPMELWTVETMMTLDPAVKWTAISLRAFADDHGRQTRTDWILRRALYPRDEVSREEFDSHLLALAIADVIVLYEVDGAALYAMVEWPAVQHPKPSRFPPPPEDFMKASRSSQDSFMAMEGESESARASEGAGALGEPPSPFCPTHQSAFGTDEDCRKCGRRRLAREEWWRQYRARLEAERENDDG